MRHAVHGEGVEPDLFLHEEATFNAISPGNAAARAWTKE
jgi:hypothetical protein